MPCGGIAGVSPRISAYGPTPSIPWADAERPDVCTSGRCVDFQGRRNTRETSLAKWHATEHAVQSALDAIQVHGANGYSNEFPVERYLRNSKAAVIYEGTSQLHTIIQAEYALGYRENKPLRCEPLPAQGWSRPGSDPR